MPSHTRRALHALSLSVASLLGACVASPIEPAVTGYTCCNMRVYGGWISSNNVQGGALVPAGEPVRLTSIKKGFYVYGSVGAAEIGLRDDGARNEEDTMRWVRRVIVATDPRAQLAVWPAEVQTAVRSAKVAVGMTRGQVLMAIGHPAIADTPDLNSTTWRYWTALEDLPVDLKFAEHGKVVALSGKASAVRTMEYGP